LTQLWYRETGPETAPPLILLHGLFASMQNWQSIAKRLNAEFHIYNLDMPNHGNSVHTPSISYEEMRVMIIEFIEEKIGQPVRLMGHSMGGKVAMLVALTRPDLVEKIIVEDMAPKLYPPWFAPVVRALVNLPIHRLASRAEADEILAQDIKEASLRTFLLTNLVRMETGQFQWRIHLEAIVKGGPSIAEFPFELDSKTQSQLPALFIRGDQSAYVKDEDMPLIRDFFPKAQIETVRGAGHWVHAQEPDLFSELARNFLR
jgi:esterase